RYQKNHLPVNAHPPTSVLFTLPFGLLPYPVAKFVWNISSLVAVAIAAVLMMSRWGLAIHSSNYWALAVLIISSASLSSQIREAQFNAFLLLLITIGWIGMRNHWPLAAGIAIGLAAGLKLFPLFIIFAFLMLRQWKTFAYSCTAFGLLQALTAGVFGIESYRTYIYDVMPGLSHWRAAWLNSSLTGFWSRVFDPGIDVVVPLYESPLLAKVAILGSSLVITGLFAWQAWRAKGEVQRDRMYAAAVIAMILLSPTAWDHYWLLLLVPLPILWWRSEWTVPSVILFWICTFLLVVMRQYWLWVCLGTPLPQRVGGVMTNIAQPWNSILVLAIPTYCLLVLYGLALTRRALPADWNAAPSDERLGVSRLTLPVT
ncbi:MAG TPA: glycosyltransferase family 87 protein, partial [Pirellulaceae bacterium]|nr:glycosyltransferase family 87 protein [Pirellulaceae bacterium]